MHVQVSNLLCIVPIYKKTLLIDQQKHQVGRIISFIYLICTSEMFPISEDKENITPSEKQKKSKTVTKEPKKTQKKPSKENSTGKGETYVQVSKLYECFVFNVQVKRRNQNPKVMV